MILAIGGGVTVFMIADVQLALARIDPNNSATWPNMGPQIRYLFIPVIAGALAGVAVIVNLLLYLVDRRRMASLSHWVLLGAAYSLIASMFPLRYLGVHVEMALIVSIVMALACVLFVRWHYGVKGGESAV
jgi:hypothetical protein